MTLTPLIHAAQDLLTLARVLRDRPGELDGLIGAMDKLTEELAVLRASLGEGAEVMEGYFGDERGDVRISPSQGLKLIAFATLLRNGDLDIRGHEDEDIDAAKAAIADVAQEIALQVREAREEGVMVTGQAHLRVKQREVAAKAKSVGWSLGTSLRWRYFRAAHPRASILTRKPTP